MLSSLPTAHHIRLFCSAVKWLLHEVFKNKFFGEISLASFKGDFIIRNQYLTAEEAIVNNNIFVIFISTETVLESLAVMRIFTYYSSIFHAAGTKPVAN